MNPVHPGSHSRSGVRAFRPLSRYPHMSAADIPVWEAFLAAFPRRFVTIEYDVRVGPGRPGLPGMAAWGERMARAISQLRIDAVGRDAERVWLVEVKPYVVAAALGQLLCYRFHYCAERPGCAVPGLLLVAGGDNEDIGDALDAFGVQRIIVRLG